MIVGVHDNDSIAPIASAHVHGSAGVAAHSGVIHDLPKDTVDLTPEGVQALESSKESNGTQNNAQSPFDIQRELALKSIQQAIDAAESTISGLGLITGP